ncbi:MAG: type III secretion system export apparatus subunit SctT [Acidiferrobacterales bacterium]|nr:type III secretion system export apparatus subunit SctT [Acidiferrobacterales bacterium]
MTFLIENMFNVLTAIALCLPRMLIALHFVPMFGLQQMPMSLKAAIVIAVSTPVSFALVLNLSVTELSIFEFIFLLLKEAVIGFILGILLAVPFWIFNSMGALIDNQRGALSAGYMDPTAGPDASMLGGMFERALLIYFIQLGVFLGMFRMLFSTYTLWPPLLGFPEIPIDGYEVLIERFTYLIESFVLYAGPVVLVLLLIESAFAILGAYSPQMQVYFMAMPAKAMVALLIVVLFFNHILALMDKEAGLLLSLPDFLVDAFGEVEQ